MRCFADRAADQVVTRASHDLVDRVRTLDSDQLAVEPGMEVREPVRVDA
jgi:hypothetical protein